MPRCWPICSPLVVSPEKVTYAVPLSSHARSGSMPSTPSMVVPSLHGPAGSVAVKTTHPRGLIAMVTMT